MTGSQRAELARALAANESSYDPAERMVRRPFHSPGYHTTLSEGIVHPTRDSLAYALALLDSGDPAHHERAVAILDRTLALQDTDPESHTYGIWSWFLEEPLEQMSPPDWNWADFCGTVLIQVARDHGKALPADLAARLDAGLGHASRSIQRRNVGPGYTNISLMGTYVTYTVGEFHRDADLLAYACERLRQVVEYTRRHGGFTEYNSPTYTRVAIQVLARMRRDIRDPEARPGIEWLYDLAWADVARHFHPPTGQWAGPHARAYHTLLDPGTQGFLQRATGGAVRFVADAELPPDLEVARLDVACPPEHLPLFARLGAPCYDTQVCYRGDERRPPIIAHTHLDHTVAISSVNRSELWNQRRPLLAYWGTVEHPTALQVRCLHDDYDYSSATLFARQAGPHVLAAVVFATDGGDRHIGLDRIADATITARDLRLRFQILTPPTGWRMPDPPALGQPHHLSIGNAALGLHVAHAAFGEGPVRLEASQVGDSASLDVVLHSGEERRIDFTGLGAAVVVFGLQVVPASADVPLPLVEAARADGRLTASWATPRGHLAFSLPERPAPFAELQRRVAGVDDT